MRKTKLVSLLIVGFVSSSLLLAACSTTQQTSPGSTPAVTAPADTSLGTQVASSISDLKSLTAEAAQAWVDVKNGSVNATWAISSGLQDYQTIAKTSADVQALIKSFSGNASDATPLAARLASLFNSAPGTTAQKIAALIDGLQTAAQSLSSVNARSAAHGYFPIVQIDGVNLLADK